MMLITDIKQAIAKLRAGEVVAFPTETVYGLGADAKNPVAVSQVFAIKNRPRSHPLIVHIAGIEMLAQFAINIPSAAYVLGEQLWPGPLTMILPRHPDIPKIVTGGQDSIALRVPKHSVALQLLQQLNNAGGAVGTGAAGTGLVGPSANKYGRVSPTKAEHVQQDLGDINVLDGGACEVGIESTIVSLLNPEQPVILRQGQITADEIGKVLGCRIEVVDNYSNSAIKASSAVKDSSTLKVPGADYSHYAPATPLYVIPKEKLHSTIIAWGKLSKKIAVLSFNKQPMDILNIVSWQQVEREPISFAKNLYATLRDLDSLKADAIIIEQPSNEVDWQAINDRLWRAKVK